MEGELFFCVQCVLVSQPSFPMRITFSLLIGLCKTVRRTNAGRVDGSIGPRHVYPVAMRRTRVCPGERAFLLPPAHPRNLGGVLDAFRARWGGGLDGLVGISEPPFSQTFSRAYTLSRKHLNSFIPTCVQVPHALRRMKSIAFGDERANGLHFDRIAAGTPTPCDEEQAQNRSGKSGEVCNPQTGSIKVFLFFFDSERASFDIFSHVRIDSAHVTGDA